MRSILIPIEVGRRRQWATLVLALGLGYAGVGCGDQSASVGGELQGDTPEAAARSLFALPDEPEADLLESMFGRAFSDEERADLMDALDAMPRPSQISVVRSEPAGFDDTIALDLEVGDDTSGFDTFSVHLVPHADHWRIAWFQGPDVSWPPQRRARESNSTSAPPSEDLPSTRSR